MHDEEAPIQYEFKSLNIQNIGIFKRYKNLKRLDSDLEKSYIDLYKYQNKQF